jgi:hypothetical protein
MNKQQIEHCNTFLSVLQGMLAEAQSSKNLLLSKLQSHPNFLKDVQKETGFLEGTVDCIKLTLDFIDEFPEVMEDSIDMDFVQTK